MPDSLVFVRSVPRQPAPSPYSAQAETGVYSRDFSGFSHRSESIYLYCSPPSSQFRVYQVTQLRTDGVHCRKSAGTGPVVLNVVPAIWVLPFQVSPWTNLCAPLLSHTHYQIVYWCSSCGHEECAIHKVWEAVRAADSGERSQWQLHHTKTL